MDRFAAIRLVIGMTNILLIENDQDTRELLKTLLTQEGYDVRSEIDGALRARPCFADTPIVMVSAKTRVRDIQCGLLAGADDYITKPFRVREVITRVKAVLDEHPSPTMR